VLVDDFDGSYYTQAKTDKNVLIAGQGGLRPLPGAALFFGELEVTEQVIAYQRRDMTDGHVIDTVSLDLPEQTFRHPGLLAGRPAAGAGEGRRHPAGHRRAGDRRQPARRRTRAHRLLPLYAMCDRWDIGGLSTAWHWQTDAASVFVYDAYPGGIGLARRGYDAFESLAADARTLIAECPCESGCPSCVQSPKCGNLNEPLSKAGAVALLEAMLRQA